MSAKVTDLWLSLTVASVFLSVQHQVELALLFMAFISVPWMLLPKPLILLRRSKQKKVFVMKEIKSRESIIPELANDAGHSHLRPLLRPADRYRGRLSFREKKSEVGGVRVLLRI
jgi:hypothetical protein